MLMSVYKHVHALLRTSYTYDVGSVLLVRVKGNTRASICGTATLQSRFFVYIIIGVKNRKSYIVVKLN